MKKHASLLMFAAMLGGFTVARAQEVEVETDDMPETPSSVFINGAGGNLILNCGGSFLGIVGDEVNDELVQKLKLPGEYGAIINEVVKESAAEKAGLQKEDVIVGYNGTRVESMAQLRRMITETPVGRTVDLTVIRNGSEQHVKAELGTRSMPALENMHLWNSEKMPENFEFYFEDSLPPDFDEKMKDQMEKLEERLKELDLSDTDGTGFQFFGAPEGNVWFNMPDGGEAYAEAYTDTEGNAVARPRIFTRMLLSDGQRLGATVQNLSPQLARYFKLDEGETGALVSEVLDGKAADKGGLKAGDVITAVDGEAVKTPMDLTRLISKKNGLVELRVMRDGRETTVKVDLGEKGQGFQQWPAAPNWQGKGQDELRSAPSEDADLSIRQ